MVTCTITVLADTGILSLRRVNIYGRVSVKDRRFRTWADVIAHMESYGPLVVWRVRVGR